MKLKTEYALGAAGLGFGAALLWADRKPLADLSGQVVLITGGSRGLGLALAREFGALGCRIAICARSEDQLNSAERILKAEGHDVFASVCDVADHSAVNELIERVEQHYGRVDILVNNAGEILVSPLENLTIADFERAMNVMFWGVVHPTLAVLPKMRERGYGRIAAITSIGGKVSMPHLLAYSCAKFAAVAFCEGLRAELASSGILVTTIAPGLMRTGSHVNATFKGRQQEEAAWFSAGASMPGVSMSAERAAHQTVVAIRKGTAEKVLSTQASVLSRFHGLMPGITSDLMALANQLLPKPAADSETTIPGIDLVRRQGPILKALTALGREAGRRLNQRLA